MSLTLAGLMVASGMATGPCPESDGYTQVIGRRALQEIMIHDAYGADSSGKSVFGLIYESPIQIRYAVNGEPLILENRTSVEALDLDAVEAVWILGDEATGTVLDLVSNAAANLGNVGICIEVVTIPVDPNTVAALERVGGPGSPGDRLAITHNVIWAAAEFASLGRNAQNALAARMQGTRTQAVQVAAPWIRDTPSLKDHPGLWLRFIAIRGDARDFIPPG